MGLSIRTKLIFLLGFSLITMALIGWYGLIGMQDVRAALNRTYAEDLIPMRLIAEANRAIVAWNRDVLNYLLSGNDQRMHEYQPLILDQKNIVLKRLQDLSEVRGLTQEEEQAIHDFQDEIQRLLPLWEFAMQLDMVGKHQEAIKMIRTELRPIIDGMDSKMAQFLELQESQSGQIKNAMDDLYYHKLKRISAIIGSAFVLSLLVNLLMAFTIIRSLSQLGKGIKEIAQGNLGYRVNVVSKDEIGQLAFRFNTMAAQLQHAHKALQKAHEELEVRVEQRTAELAETNEELLREIAERLRVEEAFRQSSDQFKLFAYSVVHDLKSPAIGVHGLTNLLQKKYGNLLDEKGKSYCDQIVRSSEHITALVENINTFIATKELPLTIETVDLQEVIQLIRGEFLPVLNARGIAWSESTIPTEMRADKLCLLRALRNFVDNALKYGGDRLGRIETRYEESDEFHIISVRDDGAGIKGQNTEKIFEIFQRNVDSKEIAGTGLGLSIVKEIAERHRGKVWVEPGLDKGTTFYISISKLL